MGASDSKLVFKKGIFRLSEERHIPADDPYWTSFWELPESSEDIFSLFSATDIRRTRDKAIENLETLILILTSRLFILRHHPSFPDPEIAPERDALNCVRILTRILPYIYERESLQPWEERFFWGARRKRTRQSRIAHEVLFDESAHDEAIDGDKEAHELAEPKPAAKRSQEEEFEEAKPLAEELIDTLIDLLFFSDLTVPRQPHDRPKVSYAIWQSGIGCGTSIPTTREHESNRCEILRLLLTLASQSMYMPANVLPLKGTPALTYICKCPDKQVVLSVLCSLLNTALKYNPASWQLPYNPLVFKDNKQILVTYTLQFLLTTLIYPIPEENGISPKNYYRHFLGRLHRPSDFQFIVDGMTRILSQPLQANASYIPGTQSSIRFAPEIIMLFWEITQCNKRFRSYIIDTERVHDFIILILFYALEYKSDGSKQGVVRMCAFLLQTLSVEKNFGVRLNKSFEAQDTLPPAIRIQGFRGTYADFLIQSIYNLITTSQSKLTAIYPALLSVINNIAPYLEGASVKTSIKLMYLFNSMSSPSFLLANDSNHDLLRSLLESMNSIIEHKYSKNPEFVFVVVRNRKRFEALRNFTLESGQAEIERRNQRRKDGNALGEWEAGSARSSVDELRSPTAISHPRAPSLSDVPEDDTFAIGDDDDDPDSDDEAHPTPTASDDPSRASSVVSTEDAVPTQVRGMSEKARGKQPAGTPSFSRTNSIASITSTSAATPGGAFFEPTASWIESWLPELPLHTILTLTHQVTPNMLATFTSTSPPTADRPAAREAASAASETLSKIAGMRLPGIEPSPIRVHSFEWSPLSLGWYESLLWSFVFSSEMQVGRGVVGTWNGTGIKLFRVQETAAQGPSLKSPRGAVDAVGSTIVSRMQSINLRGAGQAGQGARDAQGEGAPMLGGAAPGQGAPAQARPL